MYTESSLKKTYEHNMAFLKESFPQVHRTILGYELKRVRLDLYENGDVDLIDNGVHLYRKKGISYCKNEADKFLNQLSQEAPLTTVQAAKPNTYDGNRLYFESIDHTIKDLFSVSKPTGDNYFLRDHYPLLVFMGTGLGIHIEHILNNKEVVQVYIVEKDIEHFILSLYTTKWYELVPKFDLRKGKSLNFILTFEQDENEIFTNTWNELLRFPPRFPLTALFYNHRRNETYNNAIKRIQKEFHVFVSSWGFYDDEVNQLNNGIHNLKEHIPAISLNTMNSLTNEDKSIPVIIAGAGPSLDKQIDFLKENRDKFILISSGTALRSLYLENIKPDIHAEIESDYNTVLALEKIDSSFLKDIPLIGPIQLNPNVFRKFKRKLLFYKDSSSQYAIFEPEDHAPLQHSTPTCSNTALAFSIFHGFKSIYFVGMDLAYRDPNQTHAKGSIYYENDIPKQIKDSMNKKKNTNYIEVVDINGGTIKTEPIYFSTKRRIENAILTTKATNEDIIFYNASLGAKIEGTLEVNEIKIGDTSFEQKKTRLIDMLFSNKNKISNIEIQEHIDKLILFLSETRLMASSIIDKMDGTSLSLDKGFLLISHQLDTQMKKGNLLYYFIRGTYWHFMYALYSHIYSHRSDSDKNIIILKSWRDNFIHFLESIESHIRYIMDKNIDIEDDDWLEKSIRERVSGPQFSDYFAKKQSKV